MTELRTLKDLRLYDYSDGCRCEELIKAEAVKWIKEYEKKNNYADYGIVIETFKHFFNITEEDLK